MVIQIANNFWPKYGTSGHSVLLRKEKNLKKIAALLHNNDPLTTFLKKKLGKELT